MSTDILTVAGLQVFDRYINHLNHRKYDELTGFNSRKGGINKRLTWADLHQVNSSLAEAARRIADYYGYRYDLRGRYIPSNRTNTTSIMQNKKKPRTKKTHEKKKRKKKEAPTKSYWIPCKNNLRQSQ